MSLIHCFSLTLFSTLLYLFIVSLYSLALGGELKPTMDINSFHPIPSLLDTSGTPNMIIHVLRATLGGDTLNLVY